MPWRADYAKEAYHDGRDAARNGGENPHPMGCFEYVAWNRGYASVQDTAPLEKLTRMLEGAA